MWFLTKGRIRTNYQRKLLNISHTVSSPGVHCDGYATLSIQNVIPLQVFCTFFELQKVNSVLPVYGTTLYTTLRIFVYCCTSKYVMHKNNTHFHSTLDVSDIHHWLEFNYVALQSTQSFPAFVQSMYRNPQMNQLLQTYYHMAATFCRVSDLKLSWAG